MSFTGTTDSDDRNAAQCELFANIGNSSTRPRSIELAIRTEAALFERMGKRTDEKYKRTVQTMVDKLKDPKKGFELNRRLLYAELTPEKWAKEIVPKKRAERVSAAELKQRQASAPKPIPIPVEATKPAAKPAASENKSEAKADTKTPSSTTSNDSAPRKLDQPIVNHLKQSDSKQPKSKTDESSYYHFPSTNPELAKQFAPKKLENAPVAEGSAVSGASKWNKGTTWEDRNLSKWAKVAFKRHLQDIKVPSFADGEATVSNSWTVTVVDASVVYSRRRGVYKPAYGYDLSAKTSYTGSFNGTTVSGDVKIEQFDDTDDIDSVDIELTSKSSDQVARNTVKNAVKRIKDEIRARIRKFVEELKTQ